MPGPPVPTDLSLRVQERFTASATLGASRRAPEPEKVSVPALARPSALELKVEELEEKGLIRILRGPGDAVSIEILPVALATPSPSDAPTPDVPTGTPSPGMQRPPGFQLGGVEWGWGTGL